MKRLGIGGVFVLFGVLSVAAAACGGGSDDGDDAGGGGGDGETDSTVEVVDDELVPEDGEGSAAPSLITEDGAYNCSGSEIVTIEGDGLQVGLAHDCARVTINGAGNEVDVWEAASLVVAGSDNDVGLVAPFFDRVVVDGQGNKVHMTAADAVTVNGMGNTVDVVMGFGPMLVTGANHRIELASGGSTPVQDDSAGSQIEGDYYASPFTPDATAPPPLAP